MIDRTVPKTGEKALNLLVCNVYQDNTNHTKLCQLIESKDPDIVFLLETDNHWKNSLKKATDKYTYKIEVPLDNTYGLLFYSKLKLLHSEVRYMVSKEMNVSEV